MVPNDQEATANKNVLIKHLNPVSLTATGFLPYYNLLPYLQSPT